MAPISLAAIEQVQVNVAPYDVRQGNFVGAGVNTVTRSGTNQCRGSVYTRYRNESFVGTDAAGLPYNPGTFTTKATGAFLGGPIIRNRLFAFGSFEKQLTSVRSRRSAPIRAASRSPVASPASWHRISTALSQFLSTKFNYDTGAYQSSRTETPAKPFLVKFDYNAGTRQQDQFPVQPTRLEHRPATVQLLVRRSRPHRQHQLARLSELERHGSGEQPFRRRGMELGRRQQPVEQSDRWLYHQ